MSASRRLIVNADDPGRTSGVHRGPLEPTAEVPPGITELVFHAPTSTTCSRPCTTRASRL